jgi:hypothetical protein
MEVQATRRWRMWLITAGLLIAGLVVPLASAATVPPSDPSRATQLANAPATHAPDGTGQRVTPAQAVALGGGVSTAAIATSACWFRDNLWVEWGIWPYHQKVNEWRSWCAQYPGGPQTYRASQVHLGTLVCSGHDRFQFLVSGGNGSRWSSVRTGASFDCATSVPWFVIHTNRWQEWSCNTWGHCAWVTNS